MKGKFIVVEGPDGSGKSTQAQLLVEYLQNKGLEVIPVREPGGTAIGEKIRAILRDPSLKNMSVETEMLLYMASRAQLVRDVIEPALDRGAVVVADRFLLSTIVYQGAAGRLGEEAVREIGKIATGGLKPAITLIIDVSEKKWLSRKGLQRDGAQMNIFDEPPDREELKGLDFHKAVRDAYLRIAGNDNSIFIIDGDGTPNQVHEQVVRIVKDAIR